MELVWYGCASIVIKDGGSALAFDPFEEISPGQLKKPPETLPHAKQLRAIPNVLVTHGHFDHISHLPRLYRDTQTTVYCTAAPAKTLRKRGLSNLKQIGPGWTGRFGNLTVQSFQSRHCKFDFPLVMRTVFSRRFFRHPCHTARLLWLDLTYSEKGEILFYQVQRGDFRLQIMGSMNLCRNTAYPVGADVLVLPLQGRSDQNTYALELVRRLRPKVILLDHYDDAFAPLTGTVDPSGFIENVRREFAIPCYPLKKDRPVHLEAIGKEEQGNVEEIQTALG